MSVTRPDFRLAVYLGRWQFAARHHLTASDAQTLTIAGLLALASDDQREAFERLPLGYPPTWGTPALRAAIPATYDTVGLEHVLTFAGGEQPIFWALQELVGRGEHAVVTVPNYQSLETVTIATGADVDGLALRPEDGWALDLDALKQLLRPPRDWSPSTSPTTRPALPDRQTFRQLVELCEERGVRLVSGEVFRGLELDPNRTLPQAAELSPTALSLNGMSKAYGLPGLRIGWLASGDRPLLERLERRKHYTSICNAGPSEYPAKIALGAADRSKARNRAIIAANLPVFDAFFAAWPEQVAWEHPRVAASASAPVDRRADQRVLPAPGPDGRGRPATRRHLPLPADRRARRPLPHRRRPARPQPALAAFHRFLRTHR